jgi:hypothetical protein
MEAALSGSDDMDVRLLLLAPEDNVLVAREDIPAGQTIAIGGVSVAMTKTIHRGHKLARWNLVPGEQVLKYGVPIGSVTAPIACGEHVHVFNIKSDYTATHVIDRDAG